MLAPETTATELAHARAMQLLDRYGVVTREAVLAEGVPGGFAGVYGVLKTMEESGKVRRGYFVAGMGAAQFAHPGAVDRLRASRDGGEAETLVLAATDPAQPYGAALPWPENAGRPARAAGAFVVLAGGEPIAFLERGARSLLTFGSDAADWADALAGIVKDGRLRRIELQRIDGLPVGESPLAEGLRAAGFVDGYRGLTLRG
jgi:ATP-dependent Lhr-like helicase